MNNAQECEYRCECVCGAWHALMHCEWHCRQRFAFVLRFRLLKTDLKHIRNSRVPDLRCWRQSTNAVIHFFRINSIYWVNQSLYLIWVGVCAYKWIRHSLDRTARCRTNGRAQGNWIAFAMKSADCAWLALMENYRRALAWQPTIRDNSFFSIYIN